MAVTTQYSPQAAAYADPSTGRLEGYDSNRVRAEFFAFKQDGAGDANSLAYLCYLPPGKKRLLNDKSHCYVSAFGAGRTLDIGIGAYTKTDGTAVAGVVDNLADGKDVANASNFALNDVDGLHLLVDSRDPVPIIAKCLGDTLPANATITGYILYIQE